MRPAFHPGDNIAIKVPAHEYAATVAFYRDVVGFDEIPDHADSATDTTRFRFGDKVLWIDCVAALSQAEVWLEVVVDDLQAAAAYLDRNAIARRDEIEPLPDDFGGFWITGPSNIIHLVSGPVKDA